MSDVSGGPTFAKQDSRTQRGYHRGYCRSGGGRAGISAECIQAHQDHKTGTPANIKPVHGGIVPLAQLQQIAYATHGDSNGNDHSPTSGIHILPLLTLARFAKYIPPITGTTVIGFDSPEYEGAQPPDVRSRGFYFNCAQPRLCPSMAGPGGRAHALPVPSFRSVNPLGACHPFLTEGVRRYKPQRRSFAMGNSQRALALTPSPDIQQSHGRPVTTSKNVASVFGKKHFNVLRDIKGLQADCPPDWYELNFECIQIPVDLGLGRTRKDPAYEITRDGFVLLVMGFTGKQALQFKIAYLERFNEMERQLASQQRDQMWDVSGAPDGTWAVVIENGIQRLVPLVHLYRQHYDANGQHVPMANTKPAPRAEQRTHTAVPYIRNQSGVRGVYPNQSKYNPWRAYVQRDGVSYNLGTYPTIAAAHAAREQALIDIAAGHLPAARRLGGLRK